MFKTGNIEIILVICIMFSDTVAVLRMEMIKKCSNNYRVENRWTRIFEKIECLTKIMMVFLKQKHHQFFKMFLG